MANNLRALQAGRGQGGRRGRGNPQAEQIGWRASARPQELLPHSPRDTDDGNHRAILRQLGAHAEPPSAARRPRSCCPMRRLRGPQLLPRRGAPLQLSRLHFFLQAEAEGDAPAGRD